MTLPRPWSGAPENDRWQAGSVTAAIQVLVEDERRVMKLRSEIVVGSRLVAPADAQAFFDMGERASRSACLMLSHSADADDFTPLPPPPPLHAPALGAVSKPRRKDYEVQSARNIAALFIVLMVLAKCSAAMFAS